MSSLDVSKSTISYVPSSPYEYCPISEIRKTCYDYTIFAVLYFNHTSELYHAALVKENAYTMDSSPTSPLVEISYILCFSLVFVTAFLHNTHPYGVIGKTRIVRRISRKLLENFTVIFEI